MREVSFPQEEVGEEAHNKEPQEEEHILPHGMREEVQKDLERVEYL